MNRIARHAVRMAFPSPATWRVGTLAHRIRRKQPLLVVFTFHRVTTAQRSRHHYLKYSRGVDVGTFELQITGLRKRLDPIPLDRFLAAATGRERLRRDSALVTFDDADSEFPTCALPILERYGCPATVFVPTDFVDSDNRFWHLRLANLVYHVREDAWTAIVRSASRCPGAVADVIADSSVADHASRGRLCRRLVRTLNALGDDEIARTLDTWEQMAGMKYMDEIRCMSWEELRDAARRGVAIESHTVTHRKLAALDPAEIERELRVSKLAIESALGGRVRAVCYPAGSHNATVLRSAAACGYEAGFTTSRGVCRSGVIGDDRYALPRIHMEGNDSNEVGHFLGSIAFKAGILGTL